jgi:hypothetical protein
VLYLYDQLVLQSVWLIKEVGKGKGKLFTKVFIFYIRFNDSEIMLISVQDHSLTQDHPTTLSPSCPKCLFWNILLRCCASFHINCSIFHIQMRNVTCLQLLIFRSAGIFFLLWVCFCNGRIQSLVYDCLYIILWVFSFDWDL